MDNFISIIRHRSRLLAKSSLVVLQVWWYYRLVHTTKVRVITVPFLPSTAKRREAGRGLIFNAQSAKIINNGRVRYREDKTTIIDLR